MKMDFMVVLVFRSAFAGIVVLYRWTSRENGYGWRVQGQDRRHFGGEPRDWPRHRARVRARRRANGAGLLFRTKSGGRRQGHRGGGAAAAHGRRRFAHARGM